MVEPTAMVLIGKEFLNFKTCCYCEFDDVAEFCNYGTSISIMGLIYEQESELFADGLSESVDNIEFCGLLWDVIND